MPNPLLLSCWVILLPGLDVIGIWEERYWVYGWFHHVPSQHRLWIARITLCSAAWFFETGPDLRIFHAGETHNKTIQNPWLLLVRFSTTVCCDVISKQVPRKQHTHTHREKAQQASHEKSARAQVLCPSQDFFVGKVSEGCNMLWVQQTNNYVQYVQLTCCGRFATSRISCKHGASWCVMVRHISAPASPLWRHLWALAAAKLPWGQKF